MQTNEEINLKKMVSIRAETLLPFFLSEKSAQEVLTFFQSLKVFRDFLLSQLVLVDSSRTTDRTCNDRVWFFFRRKTWLFLYQQLFIIQNENVSMFLANGKKSLFNIKFHLELVNSSQSMQF